MRTSAKGRRTGPPSQLRAGRDAGRATIVEERLLDLEHDAIIDFGRRLGKSDEVVLEATGNTAAIARLLQPFVARAYELNVPLATLSHLARIVAQAGLRLFERSSRKVSITEARLLAVGHAERMLAEAKAVELSLDPMRDTPVGRIRISAPVIVGQALLGLILAQFMSVHPKCDLTVALNNRQVDLIEDYFDVALRVGEPDDGDLITRTVGHVEAAFYHAPTGRNPNACGLDAVVDAPAGLLRRDDARPPAIDVVSTAGDTRAVTVKPRLVSLNPRILREVATCDRSDRGPAVHVRDRGRRTGTTGARRRALARPSCACARRVHVQAPDAACRPRLHRLRQRTAGRGIATRSVALVTPRQPARSASRRLARGRA